MRPFLPLFVLALVTGCATQPAMTHSTSARTPSIDNDFPDPAVIKTDGYYYAYATQGERDGRMRNIQVARSRNLSEWQDVGDALPAKPSWASRTQDFWAPHVAEHGGRYFLYYSAKPDAALTDASRGLCLAVATADRPQGPFTDTGQPLLCGKGFVNIDPMTFDDPATGKNLLYWGSGFEPIRVRELAPDRVSFAPNTTVIDLVTIDKAEGPATYRRLVEGAWVVRRAGWYYLFFSGDNCCGANAHYAVMVARARSATGPYEVKPDHGGVILEANATWLAPGHNSVIEDGRGGTRIVYHAVDTRRPRTKSSDEVNSRRVMLIDRLTWRNGWPQVRSLRR